MLIEQAIEDIFANEIRGLQMENVGVTTAAGTRHVESAEPESVVAVAASFRQNDAFSLPMITVPVTVSVVTRVEKDPDKTRHNAVVEKLMDVLSLWHQKPDEFGQKFTTDKFLAGELTLTGGAYQLDQNQKIWASTITTSIRGSEKFNI